MACDVIGNETVQNYNGVTALLPPLENMSCLPLRINVLARIIIMSSSQSVPSDKGFKLRHQRTFQFWNKNQAGNIF